MKHVLIVVPRMIWPALSGGEIRVLSLMRRLSDRYRFSLATFLEHGHEAELYASALALEARGVKVHLVKRGPPAPPAADAPDIARSYDDPMMDAALRRVVEEEGVDLVHLEFTQTLQYARALAGRVPLVATEHDTSLLSTDRSYLREGVSDQARGVAAEYLRRTLGACERVVVVSDADAERLATLLPRDKIRCVPTGVDLDKFSFNGLAGRRAGVLAFVGHYAHFPNEDAAVWLCKEILPLVRREVPGARAWLIGSGVTTAARALAGPDVELSGPVPEVAPLLAQARAFVAPLRLGYGIKGKLLEAFASGTPAAATPEACEAMPGLRDGEHLLVASGAEGMAKACARLLTDDALSARLAASARAYVEERFAWDRQADLLDAVYREALGARSGAAA